MKQTVIKPFAFPQAWRAADFKDVDDISIFLIAKVRHANPFTHALMEYLTRCSHPPPQPASAVPQAGFVSSPKRSWN